MARYRRTLDRLMSGQSDASIRFDDLRRLLLRLGFSERVRGSHHIMKRPGIPDRIVIEPEGSHAVPYQVRQVRHILGTYGLAETLGE